MHLRKPFLLLLPVLVLAMAVGLTLGGCASLPTMLPTPGQLAAAGSFPDGGDADSLARGRALVVTQCSSCHRFFWPHEYSPQAWPALIQRMGKEAFLMPRQIGDVTRYMVAASRATRCDVEAPQPELALPAADPATVLRGQALARTNCGQCHRLRQPQEFPAGAWPGILRRHATVVSLSEDDLRTIAWYYVETARSGR